MSSQSTYPNHTFSDGYDILQIAICFLCEHMGKCMDTVISIDKKGQHVDIKRACFKIVNHQVHKYTYTFNKFRNMDLNMEVCSQRMKNHYYCELIAVQNLKYCLRLYFIQGFAPTNIKQQKMRGILTSL